MEAISDIHSIKIDLPKGDSDPFLRKNPIWFQKILPPSIDPIKQEGNRRHLDRIAISLLNPNHIERKQFAPSQYHSKLKNLREKIGALDNQISQTKQIVSLLRDEGALSDMFYDQRLGAVPC